MRSAVIICSVLLTFNLLLLDKGKDLVVQCMNSNKRYFLIEVSKEL